MLLKSEIHPSTSNTCLSKQALDAVYYYKTFLLKTPPIIISSRGQALCLLKTQFAKKPKNPV